GGANAGAEDARNGKAHEGHDQGGHGQIDGPRGEVGDGGDDEAHDRHRQGRVPRALPVARHPGDPGPAGEDGVGLAHHAVQPWPAKAASSRPGRSPTENSRRASSTLRSSIASSGMPRNAAISAGRSGSNTSRPEARISSSTG